MKIKIRGKGIVHINKERDFIFQGGEGSIYEKADIIYKIYHDEKQMIPEAKINELQMLDNDNIIKPEDIIIKENNKIIGFTMKKAIGEPLCKLFTNSFRDRNGVVPKNTVKLVESLQEGIVYIHDKKCLIVDLNEMNFLAGGANFTIPYFIDVNSYQTPSYKATAIMPYVQDYQTKGFSQLTDWYSFALLAFQLFVGIHPYKGKHPDYKNGDVIRRMKENVSIFDKKVKYNKAVRDFSCIPTDYFKWFKELFLHGKRTLPPQIAGLLNVIQVIAKVIHTTNNFNIALEREYPDKVLKYKVVHNNKIALTKDKLYIGKLGYDIDPKAGIVLTDQNSTPIAAYIDNNQLILKNIRLKKEIPGNTIRATDKIVVDNTLYVRNEDKIHEIYFIETQLEVNVKYSIRNSWNIMPKSSQILDGFVYQNVLGKAFLTIPVPKLKWMVNVKTPELDGYRILDGKYCNRIAILIGFKKNTYCRFVFRFAENFKSWSCREIKDIDNHQINLIVLDNGVAVMIPDDGVLELFTNNLKTNKVTEIHDPDINMSMNLTKNGIKVMFFEGRKVFNISMKGK